MIKRRKINKLNVIEIITNKQDANKIKPNEIFEFKAHGLEYKEYICYNRRNIYLSDMRDCVKLFCSPITDYNRSSYENKRDGDEFYYE